MLLRLPPPRRGCEHDDTVTLEMRSPLSGGWESIRSVDQTKGDASMLVGCLSREYLVVSYLSSEAVGEEVCRQAYLSRDYL